MNKLILGAALTTALAALALGTHVCVQAAATAPATATAPAPATATAPATRPLTRTMVFQFENASIDTVLDEMSARLGFVIQKTVTLTGQISVTAPKAVNADEAIILLNSLLVPLGYGAVERPAMKMADGTTARVLRVMTWAQAKKEAPVNQ